MKANCADFGFILRFLEGREDETGTPFEPWHFRYVGKTVAEYITGWGITLEEFDKRASEAYETFIADGGDVDAWIAYEDKKLNAPFVTLLLDKYDETGDAEVSLGYY